MTLQVKYFSLHHKLTYFIKESFERAKTWIKELNRQASPNIVIALIGNKVDLDRERQVTAQVSLE